MKILQLCLNLLILWFSMACSQTDSITQLSSNQCPKQPEGVLETSNVKSISLNNKATKESGMVSTEKSMGYTFEATSGQKLHYDTDDKVCIWVYTPDNQVISSKSLPQTGKYMIQVSARNGSTTFDLEISLETETSQSTEVQQTEEKEVSSSATSTALQNQFSKANYPKDVCGDPRPTDPNVYPVKFYPINVPYSEKNLAKARSIFCRDSIKKTNIDNGKREIQIASFTDSEKAIAFASMVNLEIAGAKVGSPTTVDYK
jgi:hypothetical protein